MANVIITIGTINYSVSAEQAKSIETICKAVGKVENGNTTKSTPSDTKVEKKDYDPIYTVGKDGKSVKIESCPTKVFYAVKATIKAHGATWNKDSKTWVFETKKACGEFEKAWKEGKKN